MSHEDMSLKSAVAFVGPCPPPLGGVAVANVNAQSLFSHSAINIESFNTSQGDSREDLYGSKGWASILAATKLMFRFVNFIFSAKACVVNIFVTSNLSFIRTALMIVLAVMAQKKIVAHLHSKFKGELFLSPLGLSVMSFFLRRCEVVIVLSEQHRDHFAKKIPVDKIEILENFVYADNFSVAQYRETLNFLFVGRLTKEKGFYDLVNAIKIVKQQLPNVLVHVLGAAATDGEEQVLQQWIRDEKLQNNIQLHGLIEGDRKYQIFHDCAGFIFPSHFENSPMVLKEALAARQIIICSDIEANINVLRNSDDKFIFQYAATDVDALAKSIIEVDHQYDALKASSVGIACPEYATDKYAFNKLNTIFNRLQSSAK